MNNASGTAYVSTGATDANGAYTFTAIPPGVYTLYSGPSSSGPWTATGDGSYVVPATTDWINVKDDYGAKGDGVTNDTSAIQSAFNAAGVSGGTVYFPRGTYLCLTALSLDDKKNIVLRGSAGSGQQTTGGSILKFNGTTGNFLTLKSSFGITVTDLKFLVGQSSYNGDLVTLDWSAANADPGYTTFERCAFFGVSGGGARSLLRLNRAIIVSINDCRFWYADKAIIGRDGSYSNVVRVRNCSFNNQTTIPIYNAGEEWLIDSCTFEPLAGGTNGAYSQDTTYSYALTFLNNWIGDGTGGTAITAKSLGLSIINNRLAVTGGTSVSLLSGCQGVTIIGNRMEGTTGISIVATTSGLLVAGNDLQAPTGISGTTSAVNRTITGNTNLADDFYNAATFRSPVTTVASSASAAGLRIPHGTAPTSPVNGDIWTTSAGLYVQINGSPVGPLS